MSTEDAELPFQADPTTDWGYWLDHEGGTWISLPKLPMAKAGFQKPPFQVRRPDGKLLHIIERPAGGTDVGDDIPPAIP